MDIINRHWTEDGTGVTNFNANERALYEAAIAEYGDPNLVISGAPMPDDRGRTILSPPMHSLHYLGERIDLGKFWDIFKKLQEEQAHEEKADVRQQTQHP